MALPATDGFAGTDGQALTTYNTNWTLNSGDFAVFTPAGETDLRPNAASTECGAGWNADTFADDQYAQALLPAIGSSGSGAMGVACRVSTTEAVASFYGIYVDNAGIEAYLFKMVTGTFTQLGSARTAPAIGSLLRLEVEGTNIRAYDDGVQMGGTEIDSSLGSGRAGVSGSHTPTVTRIDDWEGGNLGAEPAPLRSRKLSTQQRMVA